MLAAERGAARLTLSAYRADLEDLAGFLAAARRRARKRRCRGVAGLSRRDDRAPPGAANPGAAAVRDAAVLPISDQRRQPRRRPDGRSRSAAARPALAENPQPKRGRNADRGRCRLARRGGGPAALHRRAAVRDRAARLGAGRPAAGRDAPRPALSDRARQGRQGADRAAERAGAAGRWPNISNAAPASSRGPRQAARRRSAGCSRRAAARAT